MPRGSVKATNYRKLNASAKAVARARNVLRARSGGAASAPFGRRGFYGAWNRPGQLGAELKTIDIVPAVNNPTLAGTLTLLNGVATGTDYNTRVGRKITMKSIFLKLSVFLGSANGQGEMLRCLVVYDTQANSAAPTVANVLQTVAWDAPINLDNRDRFKVIYDKWRSIEANNFGAGLITTGNFKPPFLKLYKKIMLDETFSGTGATVGSIATGSVYLILITAVANSTLNVYINSRIRFYDT